MKLTFCGAAKAVTGSCHLLEAAGKRILVDCGLQQGRDEADNAYLPFYAGHIDAVVVTHAHIDHSGRIPLLVRQGFSGSIHATGMTCRLLEIMLRDSAHIQQSDAEWQNRKGKRAGKTQVEPLYTMADAEAALDMLVPSPYDREIHLSDDIRLRFTDAGHMLGSAYAEIWVRENGEERKIVFSGDIGNLDQPIIRDPFPMDQADFVVMESTYGDRNHRQVDNYKADLADIIQTTLTAGGNVIIPAFAVGRSQELLYYIREIKEENLTPKCPDFPVYLDSPLASEATQIFSGDLTGYLDDDARALVAQNVGMFTFDGLRISTTSEDSKALNEDMTPKVIISASGMCDAGRVRHHLKHNLWRAESTIVFVGYQAAGSLGRTLLDGADQVKLFGEEIAVRARMVNLLGLSSHGDRDTLLRWVNGINPAPRHVFVVHGDAEVAPQFAATLQDMGLRAHAPDYGEVYDLLADTILEYGKAPVKRKAPRQGETATYRRLEALGLQLMEVIRNSKGLPSRDLGKFADQIRALLKKWG